MSTDLTVGDAVEQTETVTKSDIDAFASVSGDSNPVHLDESYASETMFDGRIAHGMLGAGYISAALAELDGLVIYLSQNLEFKAPIEPGATVTARVEVTDVNDNQYTLATTVVDASDGTVYIDGSAQVMVRDEPVDGD